MRKRKLNTPLGASLIVLGSFFYASYGIWTKLIGNFMGGYTAAAWRSVLVIAMLVPIAIFYRKLEAIKFKQVWPYLIGMFLASLLIWGPLYFAILNAGIGLSLTVAYAAIVIGMFFFGWLLAGERFTRDKVFAAGLGLVGLALIFSPSDSHVTLLALGGAAISGLSGAFNTVLSKKIPYGATQTTLVMWATGLLGNVLMVIVLNEAQPEISIRAEWLYVGFFAVASLLATWSFVQGIKLIEAGAAGILGLSEVVFSIIFGVLFFRERPGIVALLGAVLIIVASAVPYIHGDEVLN